MRRLETYDWWPKLIADKDTLSLRQLGDRYGVTPGAISAALRREEVIRKPAPPGPRTLRSDNDDRLPPEPGDAPPPKKSRARKAGGRKGSKDGLVMAHWDMLGAAPDNEVAEAAGVSVRTVASFRARHNIAAYSGPRRSKGERERRSKIDPFKALVGTVPDRVVAEQAGVTINAVRNYRMKRGIQASGRSRAEVEAPAIAAPNGGSRAWQVTFAGRQGQRAGVVLAHDLQGAATVAAQRSGGDEVVSISLVGTLLS